MSPVSGIVLIMKDTHLPCRCATAAGWIIRTSEHDRTYRRAVLTRQTYELRWKERYMYAGKSWLSGYRCYPRWPWFHVRTTAWRFPSIAPTQSDFRWHAYRRMIPHAGRWSAVRARLPQCYRFVEVTFRCISFRMRGLLSFKKVIMRLIIRN